MKKTYILTRNTNYAPTGPFGLRSVLHDPTDPESLIEGYVPIPLPVEIPIQESSLVTYRDSHESSTKDNYGIFAKFLAITGMGVDVGYKHGSKETRDMSAKELGTKFFTPTSEYLKAVLDDVSVQSFLQNRKFKPNIYMVTGVRVASGATGGSLTEGRERAGGMSLEADGTAAGVPVQAGIKAGQERMVETELSWESSTDYIYAYRVKELIYSVRKAKLEGIKDIDGDLYAVDGRRVLKRETSQPTNDEEKMVVLSLVEGPEWVTAEVLQLKPDELVDEDGKLCDVVIP